MIKKGFVDEYGDINDYNSNDDDCLDNALLTFAHC